MEKTTALDSVTDLTTEEEWIGKTRVWRESTQTSPSRMHLGHHKSLVREFLPDHDTVAVKVPSAPSVPAIRLAQPVEKSLLQQLTLHDWIKSAQERPEILATEPPTAETPDSDLEPTPPPTRGITYNQLRASFLSAQLAIHC
jgi:hypothetical protein